MLLLPAPLTSWGLTEPLVVMNLRVLDTAARLRGPTQQIADLLVQFARHSVTWNERPPRLTGGDVKRARTDGLSLDLPDSIDTSCTQRPMAREQSGSKHLRALRNPVATDSCLTPALATVKP